jgi:glycosyltransferase involved in cell wall biosynthesis
MRILQVNKFFYLRGGSERYYFDLCDLLAGRGHEVLHFSMKHERNRPSPQEDGFMSFIDLNAPMSLGERLGAARRILYSTEAVSRMEAMISRYRPDIIHLHNISRQISPSIMTVTSRLGVPVVKTQHDLSLVCPAHSFFVNGRLCEKCAGGRYLHGLRRRCIDGSAKSTALGVAEAYLHAFMGLYKKIDWFIAPSRFLMEKVSTLSWISHRISHLPYFIPPGEDWTARNDGYVLFAGRISEEKGVGTLLDAAAMLPTTRFIVAGEGAELPGFKRYAAGRSIANVEFPGYVSGDALESLIEGAACIAVTSNSYENLPLSILEAFARGKPVVGSDAGGISELVMDGVTGYLYERADPVSLAAAVDRIVSDENARLAMAGNARELVAGDYSPAYHYDRLMEIYERVMS